MVLIRGHREAKSRPRRDGRLTTRPRQPVYEPQAGLHSLGLGRRRDGLLYVPESYHREHPAPLVLMLHGAGGNAQHGLGPFRDLAEAAGIIVLSVESRGQTWDVILDAFGPDVAFIDHALDYAFQRCAIDPTRVAAEGFSDGASYALSLGITNGDLFTHVIAFSPGFMAPAAQEGSPKIYVSHGTGDDVLPINQCSRRLVPRLQRAGYTTRYHEFEGPHVVPPTIALEALDWLTGREALANRSVGSDGKDDAPSGPEVMVLESTQRES